MAFEHRENSGSLFKNHRKLEENHADYQGSANINGKMLSVSAWIKEGKKGKYMSLSFRPPAQPKALKAESPGTAPTQVEGGDEDSLPF